MEIKITRHDPAQPQPLSRAGLRCYIQFKRQQWYPWVLSAAGGEEGAAAVCSFPGKSCTRSKPWLSGAEVTEQSSLHSE